MDDFCAIVREILPRANFTVFERAVKGTEQKILDWTDLTGYQKRELLEKLPSRFGLLVFYIFFNGRHIFPTSLPGTNRRMAEFLHPRIREKTLRLWKTAGEMFKILRSAVNGADTLQRYSTLSKEFFELHNEMESPGGG